MTDLYSSFLEEYNALKGTIVESPPFNGRIAHIWNHLQIISTEIDVKKESVDNIEIILNSLIDLIRLFKNTVVKKCSKNELADCIIKRPKFHEEFRQLESQLFALADSSTDLVETKSILNGTIIQHFVNEIDWQNTKNMLLSIYAYVDCSKDFSLQEHVTTILTLLTYLNNIPTHQSCTIRLLSTAHLEESSYRLLYTLMDPVSTNMVKHTDDHHHEAAAKSSSIFSAFSYATSIIDHGIHQEEHHTAVYTGVGQCYRAVWNGALVCIKKMNTSVFHGGAVGLREAATVMQQNSRRIKASPFLHSLIAGSVDKDGSVYFISALAPLGCLYDNLTNTALESIPAHQRTKMEPISKLSILMDVIHGINHLHSQGFVHGRLKDTNILLYEGFRAKLSDFGVQTFFTNDTRLNMKGTRGVRWTPPEVYLAELELEEAEKHLKTKPMKTIEDVSVRFPYALTPITDIYAVGLVVMVLLSEKMPFSNIPFEEGVRHAHEAGTPPTIGNSFPDYESLRKLVPYMYECTGKPAERMPLSIGLLPQVEDLYCTLEYAKQEEKLAQRNAEIAEVQKEVKEIKVKVKDHVQLISRGREIIQKRDNEKILIHNAKDRKQAELDIDRARAKLRTFEDELVGLQEDLDGAEHDIGELFKLKNELEVILSYDKKHALQVRQWNDNFDQEELLLRYCAERDRDRIGELIASADSLEELIIDASTDYSDTPLGVPNRMNPFLNVREGSTDVTPERRKEIEKEIKDGVYEYQYLADNLDTIFRVPLNPNLIPTQLKNIEAKHAAEGTNVSTRSYMDDEDDYGANYGYSVTTTSNVSSNGITTNNNNINHLATSNGSVAIPTAFSSNIVKPVVVAQTPSSSSVTPQPHVKPHTTVTYYGRSNSTENSKQLPVTLPAPVAAKKQFVSVSTIDTANLPKTAFTAIVTNEADSDDEDDSDNDEEVESYNQNKSKYPTNKDNDDDDDNIDGRISALYTPSMHFRPTDQLLNAEDDFPVAEDDIIHCQYLAASRGDWDEAVGMRRHGLGFSDLQIEQFLEANETPAHIAASFGHLQVLRELIELGGVEPNSKKTDGNTPMHCAAMRGHLCIIEYLSEVHNVSATEENNAHITPILMATTGGFLHVLKYFLELSPNPVLPHYRDSVHGATLLHWACLNDITDVVQYLLYDQSLPIELRATTDESSCVLWASYGGSLELVQFLVEQANADPKVKSSTGMTCLHMATYSGSVEKTVYLMETVRLSVTEKNNDHKSPFDLATGKCALFLNERKARGFLVGSVVDKTRKIKAKHLQEKN